MQTVQQVFGMTPNALAAAIRRASDGGEVARSLFETGLGFYRRELTQRFLAQYGHVIQTGVFRGMVLPKEASWNPPVPATSDRFRAGAGNVRVQAGADALAVLFKPPARKSRRRL